MTDADSRSKHLASLTAQLQEPTDEMLEAAARKVLRWMRNGSNGLPHSPPESTDITTVDEERIDARKQH